MREAGIKAAITFILKLIFPLPPFLVNAVLAYWKEICLMAITFVVAQLFFVLFFILLVISPLFHTFFIPSPVSLEGLSTCKETEFSDTNTPFKDPFGGNGQENSIVTALFHDPLYYAIFHMQHEGVDLIPSTHYYQTVCAYLKTHQLIMFATIQGNAHDYVDSFGALTVDITNNQGTLKVVYKHLSQFIMHDGEVHAGDPVGIMGDTGFAFGKHLHYEVRLNQDNTWNAVDGLQYIQ